jgi:hypothetical protein
LRCTINSRKARFGHYQGEFEYLCLTEFLRTSEKVIAAAVALHETQNSSTNHACRAVSITPPA